MKCESIYVVFGPWTGKYLDIRILILLWANILSFWIYFRISSAAIIHGCLWCDYVQKRVLKDMVSLEKGVEKKFIHVRFNVCGSPLEFPGWFYSSSRILYAHIYTFVLLIWRLYWWNGAETFPTIGRVRVKHRGILLTLKGTVIRSGAVKMYEGQRTYQCKKCKHM